MATPYVALILFHFYRICLTSNETLMTWLFGSSIALLTGVTQVMINREEEHLSNRQFAQNGVWQ